MPTAPVSRTERRKFPRKDVIGSQLISVDVKPQTSSALLLDISEGGFALQNLKAMKPGGTREVSFRLPENGNRINASAVVVWKDGDRAGLRLVRLDEASRPALGRWLRTLPDAERAETATPPPPAPQPAERPFIELRDEDFYSVTARARIVTCATGAAIAWEDAEGMVCRASTGVAPVTGARVQLDQGLSGECIRTASIVRCDDTEDDGRVDPEVCRQLSLRSAVIVPVLRKGRVTGLIEVFSNKPNAFSNEDIAGLKLLADQCSTGNIAPRLEPEAEPAEPLRGFSPAPAGQGRRQIKYRTVLPWVVGALVLIGGASLAYRHSGSAAAANPTTTAQPQADLAATPENTSASQPVGIPRDVTEAFFGKGDAAARSVLRKERGASSGSKAKSAPDQQQAEEDEVTVRQANGAPVPSQNAAPQKSQTEPAPAPAAAADSAPPALNPQGAVSDQGTLAALSLPRPALPSGPAPNVRAPSEVTPARLIHSVKPRYPTSARTRKIEGGVLLKVTVDAFGRVRDVNVVSGDSELAQAAVAAVRQWRYDPFKLNGKPIDGQTNVTVNFLLKGQ